MKPPVLPPPIELRGKARAALGEAGDDASPSDEFPVGYLGEIVERALDFAGGP